MKYIVDFVNSATEEQINEFLSSNGCTTISVFSAFDKCYLVDAVSKPPVAEIIESVIDDSETVMTPLSYDSNSQVTVDLTSEDEWWKTASLPNIDLSSGSYTFNRRGNNAHVYMMDSGINASHLDFEDADITNLYSYNNDFQDYNGHGTALASVISGKTCGMTRAPIKSVKVFQAGVPTYQSHFLAALDSIYTDVVANPGIFSVVNMSWSIAKNTYIENKIRRLTSINVVVICAAGNSGVPIADVTPASMPEVYVVGSYDRNLSPCNFSNYSSAIETTAGETNYGAHFMWAPGEHIRAATSNGYEFVAGTSVSAAIATAVATHNSFMFINSAGVLNYKSRINMGNSMAYTRTLRGILELTGNYTNSYNKVAGFITVKYGDSPTIGLTNNGQKITVKSGEEFDIELISPRYGTSCTLISEIPTGLVQQDTYLVGSIITDSYYVKKIDYQRTLYDGVVETCAIFLYVTADGYTPESIPVEDQILEVSVLLAQCCGNVGGTPGNKYCINGTGCTACEACGDKINLDCTCFFSFGQCAEGFCP